MARSCERTGNTEIPAGGGVTHFFTTPSRKDVNTPTHADIGSMRDTCQRTMPLQKWHTPIRRAGPLINIASVNCTVEHDGTGNTYQLTSNTHPLNVAGSVTAPIRNCASAVRQAQYMRMYDSIVSILQGPTPPRTHRAQAAPPPPRAGPTASVNTVLPHM